MGTQGNEMDGIFNLGNENLTLGNEGKFQSMRPPSFPPQLGQPTITGTMVVCPPVSVVSHMFSVKAVFVEASVEASLGGTVSVEVILFRLLVGERVDLGSLSIVVVPSIIMAPVWFEATVTSIDTVWLETTSGGPPGVIVVLAATMPIDGSPVRVISSRV